MILNLGIKNIAKKCFQNPWFVKEVFIIEYQLTLAVGRLHKQTKCQTLHRIF